MGSVELESEISSFAHTDSEQRRMAAVGRNGYAMKYADIMATYQNKFMGAWDLIDKDGRYREGTFIIERVEKVQLTREGGDKEVKPVLYLKVKATGATYHVPFVMTRRNAKTFLSAVGASKDWEGQEITIFVEDRKNFGQMAPTLSVRGKSAGAQAMKAQLAVKPTASREPGEDG
jgi:hypothetical protein